MIEEEFICPITLEICHDPVSATDGQVYEREYITRWITEHGTSPITREPLIVDQLKPIKQLPPLKIPRNRRMAPVSYERRESTVTLLPIRPRHDNVSSAVPWALVDRSGYLPYRRMFRDEDCLSNQCECCIMTQFIGICCILIFLIILIIVLISINSLPASYSISSTHLFLESHNLIIKDQDIEY